jgi:hypothetical protein
MINFYHAIKVIFIYVHNYSKKEKQKEKNEHYVPL